MNVVQHRGAPGLYLPSCCFWRESQLALDLDPPSRVLQLKSRFDEWLSSLSH